MELTIRPMVYAEAKECIAKINANMNNIRSLVLELYERKGWDALGYESWTECVEKEFEHSRRQVFYQFKAAQIEQNIGCNSCTAPLPERTIRPLARLNNNPEKQREAWTRAVETAPEGKVTAAHVQRVVREMVEQRKADQPKMREEDKNPAYGIFHAINAISHLERISARDPERLTALDRVQSWIETKRKEWSA